MTENEIAAIVVDAALRIHRTLVRVCWSPSIRLRLVSNSEKEA